YIPPSAVAEAPPPQPSPQYWYYCPSANGDYPYVMSCPEGWTAAAPRPAPQSRAMTESDPADEEGRRSPAGGAPHPRGRGPNAGRAVRAARQSVIVTTNQYKAGTVSYLSVITVQAIALANETTDVQILGRGMTAAGLLIQALGGGWNAAGLPSAGAVSEPEPPTRPRSF